MSDFIKVFIAVKEIMIQMVGFNYISYYTTL